MSEPYNTLKGKITVTDFIKRLQTVVSEMREERGIHVHEEGVDDDGDYFYDFFFAGTRGNQFHTRLILRNEQVIVVTQLPLRIPDTRLQRVLNAIHEVNSTLAVGAFTTEEGYLSHRSGFNLSRKAEVTKDCIYMTLLSNVEQADQFLPTFLRLLKK